MIERRTTQTQVKIIQSVTGIIAQFVVGLLIMAGGFSLTYYALEISKTENRSLLWIGIVGILLGAMCFPSIFDIFKNIYVTFFPNGLPILGGKRAGDIPAATEVTVTTTETEVKP